MSKRYKRLPALLVNLSDSVLVIRSKRGDTHAYARLYRKYLDSVYRYVYYRSGKDMQTAEDIAQTAFIKAWEKIGDYRSRSGSFRSWLFSIAHNAMVDHHRRENRTIRLTGNLPVTDCTGPVTDRMMLENALGKLPDAQREVVVLRFIEGYPVRDTARITGRTEEAVRSMQYRALQTLRTYLDYD